MSETLGGARGWRGRMTELAALLSATGLVWAISSVSPNFHGSAAIIASVGFLLLAGMLLSCLLEVFGLPHLTGYLALGLLAGPHCLGFVNHTAVERLGHVNTLALTLIGLAGGAELRWDLLKRCYRSLFWSHLAQTSVLLVLMTATFFIAAKLLGFLSGLSLLHLALVGVLWAVLALSRSPSATLAILAQTRARGPLAHYALAFVMSSDVLVVVLLSLALSSLRPLFEGGAGVSLSELVVLGHEILGSITLGTTLGLLLAMYLRLFGRQLLLILLALAFVAERSIHYLSFDPLLTFLIVGFVVQNLTRQGSKLLLAVGRTGDVVFVLFFATAGAHLDLPLLARLWPLALALCLARVAASWLAQGLASRRADDPPAVRRWGVAPLVSQAGLTLGMAVVIERTLPGFGGDLRSLVIATVAINEVIGPILFKIALDRSGESRQPS